MECEHEWGIKDQIDKHPEFYPNECCICGATENIEYHHPDYNFPLSVYPLCKKHHVEIHKNEVC